jgi:uncharacterized protein (TIGR02996 family)
LIAAIREAPNEDAPRLVCADWFEDQGDEASVARAEFIRTQVERAKFPPEDVQQSELEARELRLLKRYGAAWCGSHFVFKKVRFRRGFIEYVHLHLRHFLHHRRQMLALEPVRDVRLTGWYRARDDLVRRVAGCEEWRHIETLRIHHQGPHHDPRGNLILLLESPHLTGLRALHGTQVQFDADARRRFERLPFLRQLRELCFPTLDNYPHDPGGWFSDGGAEFAGQWGEMKSLDLPYYLDLNLLRQFTEMPFWDRLTALELVLPHPGSDALALLRDRVPKSLRELRLSGSGNFAGSPATEVTESFFARLAQAPLRSLRLYGGMPLSAESLGRLLDGTSRCELREMSLIHCQLTEDHARVLAGASGSRALRSLDLTADYDFNRGAILALFSSERLRSLVRLSLSGTRIGTEGAVALADANGWDRLRSLDLLTTGLDADGVRAALASPNLRHLTWLTLGDAGSEDDASLDISPDLASALTRLPHLSSLQLLVGHCDPQSKEILSQSESLAWVVITGGNDYDIRAYRANRSPERWPPVDDPQEWQFTEAWTRRERNGGAPV